MSLKLHIGNVSAETTREQLRELFARQGEVSDVKLVVDRSRMGLRRFAFVSMATTAAAQAAIEALNGEFLGGHFITVSEARDREESRADARASSRAPRQSLSSLF